MDANEKTIVQNIVNQLNGLLQGTTTIVLDSTTTTLQTPIPSKSIYNAVDIIGKPLPNVSDPVTRGQVSVDILAKQSILYRIYVDRVYPHKHLGIRLDSLNQTNGGTTGGVLKFGSPPTSFYDSSAIGTGQKLGATSDGIDVNSPSIGYWYLLVQNLAGGKDWQDHFEITWELS